MRLTTEVHARFESVGYPASQKIVQGTLKDVLLAQAHWISETKMGSKMRIVFARSHEELFESTRKKDSMADIFAELTAGLDDLNQPTEGED